VVAAARSAPLLAAEGKGGFDSIGFVRGGDGEGEEDWDFRRLVRLGFGRLEKGLFGRSFLFRAALLLSGSCVVVVLRCAPQRLWNCFVWISCFFSVSPFVFDYFLCV
jgi:hypothetical protein